MDMYGLSNVVNPGDKIVITDSLCDYLGRTENAIVRLIKMGMIDQPHLDRQHIYTSRLTRKRRMWNADYINTWADKARASQGKDFGWVKLGFPMAEYNTSAALVYIPSSEKRVITTRHSTYFRNTTVLSNLQHVVKNSLSKDKENEIRSVIGSISDQYSDVIHITTASSELVSEIRRAFPIIHKGGEMTVFSIPKQNAYPLYAALEKVGCIFSHSHAGFFNSHADALLSVTLLKAETKLKNNLELVAV